MRVNFRGKDGIRGIYNIHKLIHSQEEKEKEEKAALIMKHGSICTKLNAGTGFIIVE